MRVENLMTKGPQSCRPEDDLGVPARIMWENDCGCVPVVDAQSRVIAMITDRDICMAAYTQGRRLEDLPVSTAMSKKLTTCRPVDDARQAEDLMKKEQVRRLPVVDQAGKLLGILSLNDIAVEAAGTRSRRDAPTPDEVGLTLAAVCAHRGVELETIAPGRQAPSAVVSV
jgi:CBS domain-containing protein